eukprot:tig00001466_g8790.t1
MDSNGTRSIIGERMPRCALCNQRFASLSTTSNMRQKLIWGANPTVAGAVHLPSNHYIHEYCFNSRASWADGSMIEWIRRIRALKENPAPGHR